MPRTTESSTKDAYLDLIKRLPLRRLKNESEHAEAVRALARASLQHQGTKDSGALDYLELLADLIDQYERSARLKVDTSHRTPADVVRHLIQANSLTASGLARDLGLGQSNLSEMLSGRRDFSKKAIARLCERFGLGPAIFF